MKTVPSNVRIVTQDQGVELGELSRTLQLALADITNVAREGLLAMSVATGLAVMQAMFDDDITAIAGPKGKHNPDRTAVRHGSEHGSVVLGGRRVPVTRPRARTTGGHEVPVPSYAAFAAEDLLNEVVLTRMLAGVATRRHARITEPIGTEVRATAKATGRSAVSRRFVKQTETALAELLARDLTEHDIKVLMSDGEHFASRCAVVALAITTDGTNLPVGLWEGATEKRRGSTPSSSRRSTTPTPSKGCATPSTSPGCSRPATRVPPGRCAKAWRRCSPSPGSASTAGSPRPSPRPTRSTR